MSKVLDKVLTANAIFAANFGKKDSRETLPVDKFAILTCMDARIDPAKLAGLHEGEAYIVRNAGGRASDDALRSLIISYKLLGASEWLVIHHTDCGMESFTNTEMRDLLADSLKSASIDSTGKWVNKWEGPGSHEGDSIDWLTIIDQSRSVIEDVQHIRNHPLVANEIVIYGYIYDVETGRLIEVPQATAAGKAR